MEKQELEIAGAELQMLLQPGIVMDGYRVLVMVITQAGSGSWSWY